MDSAEDELNKPVKTVSKEKIESLLEMSLRTSSANADPFKDDLVCELLNYTVPEQVINFFRILSRFRYLLYKILIALNLEV